MPISDTYKIIFLHNPKCGGTSIEHLINFKIGTNNLISFYGNLSKPALQHLTYTQLRIIIPRDKFESYFKFTYVRNPWDRLVSTYCWYKRGFNTFEAFVNFVEELYQKYTPQTIYSYPNFQKMACSHLLPQYVYTGPDVHVYRFENFNDETQDLLNRLGINKPIPKDNVSKHEHYSTYYNERTREIVAKIYAEDIKRFGYTFESLESEKSEESEKSDESKESKNSDGSKESSKSKESSESKDSKESKDSNELNESSKSSESSESKDSKESKESKESKDSKESKESNESKESKDSKELNESKE